VAGKDRKKELARQRFERQQQRREAQQRQAQRVKIIGGVAAVVVLGGAGATVAFAVSGKDKAKTTTTTTAASAKPGECSYTATQDKGALAGGGTPPVKPVYKAAVPATIKTDLGDIAVSLDGAKAPCTTGSFAYLAQHKYFNNHPCHRLTTGALQVLQCGDPTGTGSGGPGYKFAEENLPKAAASGTATYAKGVLAMANAGPGTNGSQFFIVYGDSQLPPSYTIFGTVTSGLGIVQDVAKAGAPNGDGAPKKKVTIQDVTIAG
jgi:peptidyl-prolyl cis-trans isomerase B (cyclophilin B)